MGKLNLYEANVGDGDIIRVKAKSLASFERKVRLGGEFTPWMINSVRVVKRSDCPCEVCREIRKGK